MKLDSSGGLFRSAGSGRCMLEAQRTIARSKHVAFSVALTAVLAAVLGWLLVSAQPSPAAAAQEGPNRAALVVRFSDGRVETRCVSFETAAITGAELLERSGLGPILDYSGGLGGAVCSIAGEGCAFPREDCFCRCQGAMCEYWAYYHGLDGRWLYSEVGATSYQVTDGALEGWSWGKGNFSSGTEPPLFSFEEVCASPVAGAIAPAGAALVPVARAQELQASSARDASAGPDADMAGYAAFLLLVIFLAAAWAWVFRRRRRATLPAFGPDVTHE